MAYFQSVTPLELEIPSTQLRFRPVVLARNAYHTASIVADSVNPPILNHKRVELEGQSRLHMSWILLLSLV